MKRYQCRCGPLNDCGEFAGPGWACECDGQGHCTDWGVGGFDGGDLTGDQLQAAFEASTTKFFLDQNNVLAEVGLLAAFGLKVGDRLVTVGKSNMANPKGRARILAWDFSAPQLKVVFMRDDEFHSATVENPKRKI